VKLLADSKPLVIDTMLNSWHMSLDGAVGLNGSGAGGAFDDTLQQRLRAKMLALAGDSMTRPIVAMGYNAERYDGRNLALRLVALGYVQVYWYRGGREAWEVAGQPETDLTPEEW